MTSKNIFSNLPLEIQDAIFSEAVVGINQEISKRFNLTEDGLVKIGNLLADLFLKKTEISSLIARIKTDLNLADDQAKAMALEMAGRELLAFDQYFSGQVDNFLKSIGAKPSEYQKDAQIMESAVKQAETDRIKEAKEDEDLKEPVVIKKAEPVKFVESDEKEEVKSAAEVFQKNLIDLFLAESDESKAILDDYNGILIGLMEKSPAFKKNLEDALYQNQEILTSGKIRLEGKMVDPTISNWLKDFIDKNGSNFFDQIKLSEYVINSENAKDLKEEERKLLTKLLTLYRNVKFFPSGLVNLPVEEWEVIPLERGSEMEAPEAEELTPLERKALAQTK